MELNVSEHTTRHTTLVEQSVTTGQTIVTWQPYSRAGAGLHAVRPGARRAAARGGRLMAKKSASAPARTRCCAPRRTPAQAATDRGRSTAVKARPEAAAAGHDPREPAAGGAAAARPRGSRSPPGSSPIAARDKRAAAAASSRARRPSRNARRRAREQQARRALAARSAARADVDLASARGLGLPRRARPAAGVASRRAADGNPHRGDAREPGGRVRGRRAAAAQTHAADEGRTRSATTACRSSSAPSSTRSPSVGAGPRPKRSLLIRASWPLTPRQTPSKHASSSRRDASTRCAPRCRIRRRLTPGGRAPAPAAAARDEICDPTGRLPRPARDLRPGRQPRGNVRPSGRLAMPMHDRIGRLRGPRGDLRVADAS